MVHIWFIYFSKLFQFIESVIYELLLLPQLSANEILAHAKTFGYRLFEKVHLKTYIPRFILNPIVDICAYPMAIWYYFNIQLPVSAFLFVRRHVRLIFDILFRRSFYLRQLFVHASALRRIVHSIWRTIIDTKLSDIVGWCIQAFYDVLYEYLVSRRGGDSPDEEGMASTLSYDELAELLAYTECEDTRSEEELSEQNRRIKKLMHNPFPVKPFRATVRLPTPSRANSVAGAGTGGLASAGSTCSKGVTSEMIADEIGSIASDYIGTKLGDNAPSFVRAKMRMPSPKPPKRKTRLRTTSQESGGTVERGSATAPTDASGIDVDQFVSPASFPTTPFSRSRVMNMTSQRVDSTMFNVRDMLRLEELSGSRDNVCRRAAERARETGQIAVFDDSVHASEGIALCCGNHCAMKVGKGTCSSCRSTVPVLRNCWVYMEFSITVSGSQVPWLALGLVSADAPLNMTVGSWEASCAMNSDGQLLIGSRWFQAQDSITMLLPGTTVGMLVYVESEDEREQLQRTAFSSMFLGGGITPMRSRGSRGSFTEQQVDIEDEVIWSCSDVGLPSANARESDPDVELTETFETQERWENDDSGRQQASAPTKGCLKGKQRSQAKSGSPAQPSSPYHRLMWTIRLRLYFLFELVFSLLMWVLGWVEYAENLFRSWILLPLLFFDFDLQIALSCRQFLIKIKDKVRGPNCLDLIPRSSSNGLNTSGNSGRSGGLSTSGLLKNNSSVRRAMTGQAGFDGDAGASGGTGAEDSWLVGGSDGSPVNSSSHSGLAMEHILGGGGSGSSESNNQLSALAAASCTPLNGRSRIQLKFNINGRLKSFKGTKESQMALERTGLADRKEVYPCVSILSENTRIWNRFCEADIVYKQRSQIGAPEGVKVYCLDGSLLLSEND